MLGEAVALKDADDMIVIRVFQNLEFKTKFVDVFCVEADYGPVGLVVEGLDFLAEPVSNPQVLQDIANGVVNVLHLSRLSLLAHAEKNPFSNTNERLL